MVSFMEINSGDTAWVLVSAALVLLMTPGVALFYGGMVRAKSVLNMMMMSFGAMATISVAWVLWGYSEAFGQSWHGLVGNPFQHFGLSDLLSAKSVVGTIPTMAFVAFQAVFAIITVALISGAIADRAKYSTWLVFTVVWATIVYFPVAHWVFAFDGFAAAKGGWIANSLKTIDFAGGTAVHINAGADHDEGHVVRPHRVLGKTDPLAEDEGQDQACGAGVDVNRRSAGEVNRLERVGDPATLGRREAVEGEHPVRDREVDDRRPHDGEDQPGRVLRAVRDRPTDQGHRDDGEHRLESHERHGRDRPDHRLRAEEVAQAEVLERIPYKPVPGLAERLAVAPENPGDADRRHRPEAHHHHVQDALGPDHAAVEEGYPRRHQQHQCGTDEDPGGVAAVDFHEGNHGGQRFRIVPPFVTSVLAMHGQVRIR